ncbi:MAG: enoyl-CoA hydratase-related protein [Candidatus Lokiarchaeota archaeon]
MIFFAQEQFYHLNISEPIKKKLYHQWRISELIPKLRKISQPIISIIQGAAVGGGLGLIMASDIRLASEEAKFINASINIGLTGGDMGSSYFLPRLIGMSRAAELLYTGKAMDAKTAEKVGFISKLVKKEELLDKALELASEMLKKSPLGLRLTKESINLSLDSPSLNSIIQFENSSIVLAFSSKDINEASSAFFTKKEPKYPLK